MSLPNREEPVNHEQQHYDPFWNITKPSESQILQVVNDPSAVDFFATRNLFDTRLRAFGNKTPYNVWPDDLKDLDKLLKEKMRDVQQCIANTGIYIFPNDDLLKRRILFLNPVEFERQIREGTLGEEIGEGHPLFILDNVSLLPQDESNRSASPESLFADKAESFYVNSLSVKTNMLRIKRLAELFEIDLKDFSDNDFVSERDIILDKFKPHILQLLGIPFHLRGRFYRIIADWFLASTTDRFTRTFSSDELRKPNILPRDFLMLLTRSIDELDDYFDLDRNNSFKYGPIARQQFDPFVLEPSNPPAITEDDYTKAGLADFFPRDNDYSAPESKQKYDIYFCFIKLLKGWLPGCDLPSFLDSASCKYLKYLLDGHVTILEHFAKLKENGDLRILAQTILENYDKIKDFSEEERWY